MRRACIATLALLPFLPMDATAQGCDALPRGVGFCAGGGDWQRAPDYDDIEALAYAASGILLVITAMDIPPDLGISQSELRQVMNASASDAHIAATGRDISYWIEDELYIDDTLANRTVFVTYYNNEPVTYAETMVMHDGWITVVRTIEAGPEFTDRHIDLHEDALGRIALY